MKKLIFLVAVMIFCSCTNEEKSKHVLEDSGYSNIKFTGYSWLTCDGMYSTGFIAKSTYTGRMVTGTVCGCGSKGYTIRLD
jgi:hypothetical protein